MSIAPTVSVLLPVRDGGPHLDEAIDSLERQTLTDFEVLAVDDGSQDDTYDRLEAWASRDARVVVLRQEPAGIVPALEAARAGARGRYLARMDADDVASPDRLERQLASMESDPSLVLCGCHVEYFPEESVKDGARRYQEWLNTLETHDEISRELLVECPVAHPTFFMRADAFDKVGGYRDAGWAEDYDLLLRLWLEGGRLGVVPERLLAWREGPERLSRTHARYTPEAFRSCKVHYLLEMFPGARDGVVIWGAGPVGKAFARELSALGVKLVAFCEVDPRKIGQEIHGAPVLDTPMALENKGDFHIGAVGQPGVRSRLRNVLTSGGFRELESFVVVA